MDLLSELEEVRAIIIAGSGERAFAAGADIEELSTRSYEDQQEAMSTIRVCETVYLCPKPTIAAIHGYCLGGGLELALACDIRVADRTARIGLPEVRLGLIPGGGGTQRLPWLVGRGQALRLALTGDPVDAEEAHRIGLVEFLVEPGLHLDTAHEIAGGMARWSADALRLVKESIRTAAEKPLNEGLAAERELFLQAFAAPDASQAIRRFLNRE